MRQSKTLILILLLLIAVLPLEFLKNSGKEEFPILYGSVLELSVTDVESSDYENILLAMDDYDNLTDKEKEKYEDDYSYLHTLLEVISIKESVQIEVLVFRTDNALPLALTVETVEIFNKESVEAALGVYNLLSPGAQAELTEEKALLDNLLEEINRLELIELEISTFKDDHALPLVLTVEDVEISDKAIVEAALAAYELLSPEVKAGLTTEKALLDELLEEISNQEIALEIAINLEISTFQEDHASPLALTVGTVEISDRELVEAALAAYELLSPEAKAGLTLEKALLDELLEEILNKEIALALEISTFQEDHALPLALTVETVEISDRELVEAALAAYELLSPEAQAGLTIEKALLDDLLEEIFILEISLEISTFQEDHALPLAITIGTVQISDKAIVEAALAAYDILSPEAQAGLTIEKALLDELLEEIINQEIALEVLTFKENHALPLELILEDVQISDREIVEAALAAYELLSPEARNELSVEKALLDSLLLDIIDQIAEIDVETFKIDHAVALMLTIETVEISDRAIVEAALVAYDLLSPEAKAKLAVEKALLDSLLEEIENQELALEISIFVNNHDDVLELTTETVRTRDKDEVEEALLAYDELSRDAKSELRDEKSLLEDLLDRINDIEELELEIETFETDHEDALDLRVNTVEISDKAIIESALDDYDDLSTEAKEELADEKELLDELLLEIELKEIAALEISTFQEDHAEALALTVGTVEISDKDIVEGALAAYDLLSPEAQDQLTDEKALLDSLLAEILVLEATAAVELAETELTDETRTAAQVLVTALPDGAEKTALQDRIDAIVTIEDELATAKAEADTKNELDYTIDSWSTLSDALALPETTTAEIEAKTAAINTALDNLVFSVDLTNYNAALAAVIEDDYTVDSWATYQSIVDSNVVTVENTQVEIDEATSTITTAQADLVTKVEAVIMLIAALPATGDVLLSDQADIEAARAAYDALTPEQQALVTNYADLQAAEAELANLAAATAAVELAELTNSQADVDNAQLLVDALPDGAAKTDLQNRLDAVQAIIDDAEAAASVEMLIANLPASGDVLLSDQADIEAARAAYDALTPEQQALVTNYADLQAAEAELANLAAATAAVELAELTNSQADVDNAQLLVDALLDGAAKTDLQNRLDAVQAIIDDAEAAASVEMLIANLPASGDVLLSDQADIEAARAAYDALTPEQQALVTNYADLQAAEAELAALTAATAAVELAELTNSQADVDNAQLLVDALPDGAAKTDLQNRLDAVQAIIDDAEAAASVEMLIANLPASGDVLLSDQADIEAARAAYDALTPEQQALVTNYADLQAAEAELANLAAATAAVELAELTNSQADVDNAQLLVDALPDGAAKTDLQNRLDAVQAIIDDADAAASVEMLIANLPASGDVLLSDQADIEAARAAYDALTPEQQALVTNYADLQAAEAELAALTAATAAVELAELTNSQADVDNAQLLVDALPDGAAKTDLQNRLNAVQAIIDDAEAAASVEMLIANLPASGDVLLSDQADIEAARAAYDALTPEQQALVTNYADLQAAEAELANLAAATAAVELAELTNSQADVDNAQLLVDALLDGAAKTDLQNRLDAVQAIIDDAEAAASVEMLIANLPASGDVLLSDQADIEAARAAYDALTPEQQALVTNYADLQAAEAELAALTAATAAVELAELTNSQADVDNAQLLVDALPDGAAKTDLQNRLDAVQAIIDDAEAAASVEMLIANLPASGDVLLSDQADIEAARAAYDALTPEQQALVTNYADLQAAEAELAALTAATAAVELAELTNSQADVDNAQLLVDALPDGAAKTDLQNRLDAVQAIIDDAEAAASVEMLIANLPASGDVLLSDQADIEAARAAYDALTPEQQALVTNYADLQAAEAELVVLLIGEATAAVELAETSMTDATRTAAQNLVSALPDGTEKTALQIRLDAIVTLEDQVAADQADVDLAQSLIEDYFVTGYIVISNYAEPVKMAAFLDQANLLVDGLGVVVSVESVTHSAGNKPSTFNIGIEKNGIIVYTTIIVNYGK